MSERADEQDKRANAPEGALSPGTSATGSPTSDLGSDSNPFEQGTGDPTGAATIDTPGLDGGRPDGDPEALVRGNRVATTEDMDARDPVDESTTNKQTVANDAVAGETVTDGLGDGNDGPTGGAPREQSPVYNENDLAREDIDLADEES